MQFADFDITAPLCPGSILRVRRMLYWHYGIYCGDNKVIHLTCYPLHIWETEAKVKMTSCDEFIKTSKRIEFSCTDRSADVLMQAKKRIGESNYSLFTNNCRHFAYSCIPARLYSK